MKNIFLFTLLTLTLTIAKAQETPAEKANKALQLLLAHDYPNVELMFDTALFNELGRHHMTIKDLWPQVEAKAGAFIKSGDPIVETSGKNSICSIVCDFEKGSISVQNAFNENGRMTGIFFRPAPTKYAYHTPEYADTSLITEQTIYVVTGKYKLRGIVTLPKDAKNVPLVVLVHGSGPADMDETTYQNKPFKDLALGLATKGIATLRYDKRTLRYSTDFTGSKNSFTVNEETVEDAVSAIKIAKNIAGIDSSKIYVLGHSLGGMLAPRIAKKSTPVAGVIMMAAPARPLEDLLLAQHNYFLPAPPTPLNKAQMQQQEHVKKDVRQVKKIKTNTNLPADSTIFSLPLSYWADLNGYKQVTVAKTLKKRILMLQGLRDYQVTATDFNLWKAAFLNKTNVTFKSYLKLNHLFEEGEGRSTPKEYHKEGHIPSYVITDIANWISK